MLPAFILCLIIKTIHLKQFRRRVVALAVKPAFEMQVRAVGIARVADIAYNFALLYGLARLYDEHAAMCVERGVAAAVIDHNIISPAGAPGICRICAYDRAALRGNDGLAIGAAVAGEVHTLVVAAVAPVRGDYVAFRRGPDVPVCAACAVAKDPAVFLYILSVPLREFFGQGLLLGGVFLQLFFQLVLCFLQAA